MNLNVAINGTPLCQSFLQGLSCFKCQDYHGALELFRSAERDASPEDTYRFRYMVYHGYVRVYLGDHEGVELCRLAAMHDDEDPEIFEVLVRAELRLHNRKRAFAALARGLRMHPDAANLIRIRQSMGVRRPPVVRFLSRDHALNRVLGKLLHQ